MLKKFNLMLFCSLLFLVILVLPAAKAQAPSLAANDQYMVTVETENGDETFAIIRDGRFREHFYYLPIRPVVASKTVKGKREPIFNLLTYQTNEGQEGGILQMSMVMGVSKKAQDELLKKVTRKFLPEDPTKMIKLSPMPIKKAEIALYDLGGDLLDQAAPKGGIAPIFGTQHYPFMLRLTKLGSDVMAELTRKNGGLPVLITYTFSGMTPKVGFEVEVDWDACYQHFSTDTNAAISGAKNAVSGGLGLDISTLREEFETKGLIKIQSLGDETVTTERLDELMSPVLNLITQELFEQIHAPQSITPAEAQKLKEEGAKSPEAEAVQAISEAALKATKRFFNVKAQVNFALKDAKIVKKGKFTYKFDRQTILDRTSCFGGLLGIGDYPEDVQKKCITVMPPGRWESAIFSLPEAGDAETLGFKNIVITVTPEMAGKEKGKWEQVTGLKIQTATFNRNNSGVWQEGKNNKEILNFFFPLKAIYDAKDFKPENYRFKVETKVNPMVGSSVVSTVYRPMFDGQIALAEPGDLYDLLLIDGCCLDFGSDEGQVLKVIGQVQSGKSKNNISLTQDKYSNVFLIPKDEKNVLIPTMKFAHKKGIYGEWKNCRTNLRELEPSLQIMLFQYDWLSTEAAGNQLGADAVVPSPL